MKCKYKELKPRRYTYGKYLEQYNKIFKTRGFGQYIPQMMTYEEFTIFCRKYGYK